MNTHQLGPVMADVAGQVLAPADRELLGHPSIGGVTLFARNYESREQLAALVRDLRALRDPPLLIAVDQEGGRVQRFQRGFTRLPALARLGDVYCEDRTRALDLAERHGWLLASELRCAGVDLSFAPVLDLRSSVSSVIGERAFAAEADTVVDLALAMARGLRRAGMACVGKHFPGHGSVAGDSHEGLPADSRDLASIEATDLAVFRRMVEAGIPALMMGHVLYPALDRLPACFSARWIAGRLRQGLGFEGLVFSDDLSMGAADAVGPLPERAGLALDAGCDVVLVCNRPDLAWATAVYVASRRDLSDPGYRHDFQRRLEAVFPDPTVGVHTWDALEASPEYREGRTALESLV